MDPAESTESARGFLRALYGDQDRVAVLAVGRTEPKKVHQRIAPAEHVLADRFQAWLRYLNAQGHDIFVGMNPIRPGTKRREKADIAEVRRLQLDLDEDGARSLRKVLRDAGAGRLPQPAIVVRSSENRYQVLWHTAPGAWSGPQAEETMARLAQAYAGDHVHDIARCMRLPGFRNKKDGRDDAAIRWTDYGGRPVQRADFEHLPPVQRESTRGHGTPRPRGSQPLSQSERDWAEVRDQLREGVEPAQVIEQLAHRRQDKHNPPYYARRTVERAADSLSREEPSNSRRAQGVGGRGRPPPQHSRAPAHGNSPSLADSGEGRLPLPFRPDWSGPGR